MGHLLLLIIYLAFISLGLPDGLLGAAWPSISPSLDVPISFAGFVSMTICLGTVISSLQSDRLTKAFGTGKVTAFSVFLTAVALAGFSISSNFWMLLLWALPYGFGAGCIDASLNNYVAIHYASRHMSWLHCMWGVGASLGPVIMGLVLTANGTWNIGYLLVAALQFILTAILFISLPLWKRNQIVSAPIDSATSSPIESISSISVDNASIDKENYLPPEDSSIRSRDEVRGTRSENAADITTGERRTIDSKYDGGESPVNEDVPEKAIPLRDVVRIPGALDVMLTFFCYAAVEQTTALWAGSYFVFHDGIAPDVAAGLASLFFFGITIGRAISGFMTIGLSDKSMVRIGEVILVFAVIWMVLPFGAASAYGGVVLIGLGCSPIFPCLIHATPGYFGTKTSQAVIGAQMASAYTGTLVLPPLFGAISTVTTLAFMPVYIGIFLVLMILLHERLLKRAPLLSESPKHR